MKLQLMSLGLSEEDVIKYSHPFNTVLGKDLYIDSMIKINKRGL